MEEERALDETPRKPQCQAKKMKSPLLFEVESLIIK